MRTEATDAAMYLSTRRTILQLLAAAALLLSKFAGATPWVHLDIAGTSWLDQTEPHAPKGSTGAGVRTLVELACESDGK